MQNARAFFTQKWSLKEILCLWQIFLHSWTLRGFDGKLKERLPLYPTWSLVCFGLKRRGATGREGGARGACPAGQSTAVSFRPQNPKG